MKKTYPLFILTILLSAHAFGQWTTANLSEGKTSMGSVAYGSKVYFGGGGNLTEDISKVEIYDINTGTWAVAEQLSIPREFPAAGAAGGKVFFAGGINFFTFEHYSRVDIFDTLTHVWTMAELPEQKFDVAAISYGDRLFFAGGVNIMTGINSSAVDIYNVTTGTWMAASLSEPGEVRAVAVGTKLYFVGAAVMDIYDTSANAWTAISLPDIRPFAGVAVVGNQILIAGGMNLDNTPSDRVDIYDLGSGSWTQASLSLPRAFINNAATVCGKAFFAGGGNFDLTCGCWIDATNVVDIYDPETGVWMTDHVTHPISNHSVVASGDHLLVAGGIDPADLTTVFSTVDIYTCNLSAFDDPGELEIAIEIGPNPTDGIVKLNFNDKIPGDYLLTVTDVYGRIFQSKKLENVNTPERTIDLSGLPAGFYLVSVSNESGSFCSKVVKR